MIGNLSLLHTVWLSIVNSSNTGIDPDLHVVITVIAGALVHNDAEQPMGIILTLGLLTFKISCYHLWFRIHVLWSGDIILHDLVECIAILIVQSLTNTWYQSIPLHIKIPNINSKGVSNELSIHFEVNDWCGNEKRSIARGQEASLMDSVQSDYGITDNMRISWGKSKRFSF